MHRTRNHVVRLAGLVAVVVLAAAAAAVGTAQAVAASTPCTSGDIVVSTTADSGAGSLRAAFASASSAPTSVLTICVDPLTVTTPIQLSSGVLTYAGGSELHIEGKAPPCRPTAPRGSCG